MLAPAVNKFKQLLSLKGLSAVLLCACLMMLAGCGSTKV